MARVIGEAAVRLRLDPKGLDTQFKAILQNALKDIDLDTAQFDVIEKEADDSADRSSKAWQRAGSLIGSAMAGAARVAVTAFAAVGALGAASSAVTGLQSLLAVVISLGAALTTMAGALGIIPAGIAGTIALTTTLKLGLQGMGDAFSALAEGDMKAFNEALKELSPSARAFAQEVRKLKPAFDAMQLGVQEALFKGLGEQLKVLGGQYLPVANRLFTNFATILNFTGKEIAGIAAAPSALESVNVVVDNLTKSFSGAATGSGALFRALLDIVEAGSGPLVGVGNTIGSLAQSFGEFIARTSESGQLQAFFQAGVDAVGQFLSAIGNLGAGLFNVFNTASSAGAGFLNILSDLASNFRSFTESAKGQEAILGLFGTLREVANQVKPILLEIGNAIGTLGPVAQQVAAILGPALLTVFQQLGPVITALSPALITIAQTLAQLLSAVAPLLPMVAGLVNSALQPLMGVIQILIPPLQQLISAILPPLQQLFGALSPVLAAVATIVATLVTAFTPLLPPILDLVTALLPPLVQLLTSLTPVIQIVANIITAVVVPAFQFLAEIIKFNVSGSVAVITGAVDIIVAIWNFLSSTTRAVWNLIVGLIRNPVEAIKTFISTMVNNVKSLWDGLWNAVRNAASNGINAVLGFFRGLGPSIVGTIKGFIGSVVAVGGDIIDGLVRGLRAAGGAVVSFLKGLVTSAINAVKSLLGISSPSKVFAGIGKDTMRGLIKGVEDMAGQVDRTFKDVGASAADSMVIPLQPNLDSFSASALSAGTALGTQTGAGQTVNYHQTNVMQPGADVRQFADEVNRRGAFDLAAAGSLLGVSQQPVQFGINDQRVNGVRT